MSDDQRETIAFLSDSASYGVAGAKVERIETHISRVFLAGDRVWKRKRAVTYPYVDFAIVAQREAACRAELDLNRRTAPELYLAVHAITRGTDGRLAFDGAGLFDRLAETHRLTPALMRTLADEIAAFHGAAAPSRDHGGLAPPSRQRTRPARGRRDRRGIRGRALAADWHPIDAGGDVAHTSMMCLAALGHPTE
jgi:aminoglycoside phosphotransferase family enzyme